MRSTVAFPAAVILAAFIWSTSFTATKATLDEIPPLTIGAARFLAAAVVLRAVIALWGISTKTARPDLVKLATGGLLGITMYFGLENVGVEFATASDAVLLVAAYPAITLLLESLLFGVRGSFLQYAGVALAMLGVYLIVRSNAGGVHDRRLLGDVLLVVSGVVWAFYNFVTRSVSGRYPMLVVVYWQTLVGALAFVPLALLETGRWQVPSAAGAAVVLYLAVPCSIVAFMLYGYGLRGMRASSAVNLLNFVPVFGLLVAVGLLHESVSATQLIGGVVVICGVLLGLSHAAERDPAARERRNGHDLVREGA